MLVEAFVWEVMIARHRRSDEQRPPKLGLENYPHLPTAEVALPRAADDQVLLEVV